MSKAKLLTTMEAADIVGCSIWNMSRLLKAGKIKGGKRVIQEGSSISEWRVPEDEVRKFALLPQKKGWKRGKKRSTR